MGYRRKFTPEHKEKLRQAHIGKKHTEETKRRISEKHKAIWAKIPLDDEITLLAEIPLDNKDDLNVYYNGKKFKK